MLVAAVIAYWIIKHFLWFDSSCEDDLEQLKQHVCQKYTSGHFVGTFCHDLCSYGSNVIFKSCPNRSGHNGKEVVFSIEWNHRPMVLKSRNLKLSDLMADDQQVNNFTLNSSHLLSGIKQTIIMTFATDGDKRFKISSLVPWPNHVELDQMNLTSLENIWFLLQDNEYILTKVLGDSDSTSNHQVFPKILGSCGHLYLTEYSDEILDLSFMRPNIFGPYSRSLQEKIAISIKLMDFLINFQALKSGLELCDVKFDHFGLISYDRLVMIDSDMIYHKRTANQMIEAISDCKSNEDCDFIDCQGICSHNNRTHSSCLINSADNNLKRVCRNMFFMGDINLLGIYAKQFGLLPDFSYNFNEEVSMIQNVCSKNDSSMDDLNLVKNTLKSILENLERIN